MSQQRYFKTPDGDTELGDIIARRGKNWFTVCWMVTENCSLKCKYCLGPNQGSPSHLINNHGPKKTTEWFERIRQVSQRDVFVVMTGGEPCLQKDYVETCCELARAGFYLQLQTNFVLGSIERFIEEVDPQKVLLIDAAYHPKIETEQRLKDRYMRNFHDAHVRGFPCVMKLVATPGRIKRLDLDLAAIRNELPGGAKILIQMYIEGYAWPKAYSKEHKETLNRLMECRRNSNIAFYNDAGWFTKMRCTAGKDYVYMNPWGEVFRCFGQSTSLGTPFRGITLMNEYEVCGWYYCGCVQRGMWWGVDPWNYISNTTKDKAYWARFGPKIPSLDVEHEEL